MLRVWSDFLMAADRRHVTLLSLLDMLAALDCVDYSILQHRLRYAVGLSGAVYDWIESFLYGRTQQIVYNGQLSGTQYVLFGILQGSVLGPVLYSLYTAELAHIVARHGLLLHQYADSRRPTAQRSTTQHLQLIGSLCAWLTWKPGWKQVVFVWTQPKRK